MFRSLWSYIYVYYIRYFTDLKNRANIAILTEDLKKFIALNRLNGYI